MGSIEPQPYGGDVESDSLVVPRPRDAGPADFTGPDGHAGSAFDSPFGDGAAFDGPVVDSAAAAPPPPPEPADPFASAAFAASSGAAPTPEAAESPHPGSAQPVEPVEPAEPPAPPAQPTGTHRAWPTARQQISTWVALLGWVIAAFLIGHRYVPDNAGVVSFLESWLPWFAVPVAALLLAALAVRSPRALIATVAAAGVWLAGYGPQLLPRHGSGLPATLRLYSEDINDSSVKELAAAGRMAIAQNADVVALTGVYPHLAASTAPDALNARYKYHITQYEFGLWSMYPISSTQAIPMGTETSAGDSQEDDSSLVAAAPHIVVGALRVQLATPQGALVLYMVHLPEPVLADEGFATQRNSAIAKLVKAVDADHAPNLAIVGDVDVSETDRYFSDLAKGLGLTSAQAAAGAGFGFTWPAEFPVVRLDDVLSRGAVPVRSVVLPALEGGQTHLPIEVDLHM